MDDEIIDLNEEGYDGFISAFGGIWANYINKSLYDLARDVRPYLTEEDFIEGLESGAIKIIFARHSNWPYGKSYIPPAIVIEEGF